MAVGQDEQVVGLQVAMDDALLVSRGDTPRNLERITQGLPLRNRPCGQPCTQCLAFQQLRDGIGDAALNAEIEDREDVGVRKRRDRQSLPLEAGPILAVLCDGVSEEP